jgi:hypothetical protein
VWQALFDEAMARIAGRFRRVEPRRTARLFLLRLLSGVERKNCWQLAEHAGLASPSSMQRLLREAVWDAEAVRDDVRDLVSRHLGHPSGVLIVFHQRETDRVETSKTSATSTCVIPRSTADTTRRRRSSCACGRICRASTFSSVTIRATTKPIMRHGSIRASSQR